MKLAESPGKITLWLLVGVLCGVAIELRGSALYLPLALATPIVWRSWRQAGRRKGELAGALVMVAMIVLAILPWKYFLARHNLRLSGLTSLEGISLYEAVYPDATGGPKQGEIMATQERIIRAMREDERDRYYRHEAWKEIGENPGRVALLAPVKLGRFWWPGLNETSLTNTLVNAALWVWYLPLFGLMAVGILRGGLRGRGLLTVLLPMAYFAVLHMIFLGSVRYRVPLHPMICMLAGLGAVHALERMSGPQKEV
jgi:hypothetical protein